MPRTARAKTAPRPKKQTEELEHPVAPDGPFKRLGLHGLEGLAPILVAALATEEPLLLIGPHGTAKSLLLTRIAAALELPFRHYNASLLNFDDLVGFPLPGKDGPPPPPEQDSLIFFKIVNFFLSVETPPPHHPSPTY